MEFNFGDTLKGRYWLVKPLGDEESPDCWLATDEVTSEQAVVDVLSMRLHRQTFSEQATIISSLQNPSLAEVIDIGEQNENPYLVMKYINGPTLEKALTNNIDTTKIIKYFHQTLAGLAALHDEKIITGSFKSKDLIIDLQKDQIKLTSFFNFEKEGDSQEDLQSLVDIFIPLLINTEYYGFITQMSQRVFSNASEAFAVLSNAIASNAETITNKALFQPNPVKEIIVEEKKNINLSKLLAALATIICLLVVVVYVFYSDKEQEDVLPSETLITVPSFVGLEVPKAQTLARQNDLTIIISGVDSESDEKDNTVLRQTPEAGEEVAAEEAINVIISSNDK